MELGGGGGGGGGVVNNLVCEKFLTAPIFLQNHAHFVLICL